MALKKVFTTGEIARRLQVAPRTVAKWFDSGELKGYRIPGGTDRRVPRDHLIRFLKDHDMPLGDLETEAHRKVLAIAVDPLTLSLIRKLLPESGDYRYETADNAFQAGTVVYNLRPNAVLLDFALGRSEAAAIARRLRRDAEAGLLSTLVLGLAGEDEQRSDQEFRDLGFSAVYKRPLPIAEIAAAVSTYIDAIQDN